MSSPKRLTRIAGVLYLIVGIFGGFAIAYVTATVYVPGRTPRYRSERQERTCAQSVRWFSDNGRYRG